MKFEDMTIEEKIKLPYRYKILLSISIIQRKHDERDGLVACSFSAGRDSSCMRRLCEKVDPDMPLVFFDTGIEAPETIEIINEGGDRITKCKPKKSFYWALKNKGFPLISKNQSEFIDRFRQAMKKRNAMLIMLCCDIFEQSMIPCIFNLVASKEKQMRGRLFGYRDEKGNKRSQGKISNKYHYYAIHGTRRISNECCNVLKKNPAKQYYKKTGRLMFVGTKAVDSNPRMRFFKETGCFNDGAIPPQAYPIHFWTEADINKFVEEEGVKLSKLYEMDFSGGGCQTCGFGLSEEKRKSKDGLHRFERMETTHPKQYKKIMDNYGMRDALAELDAMTSRNPDYGVVGFYDKVYQYQFKFL